MSRVWYAAFAGLFIVFVLSRAGAQTSCSSGYYWDTAANSCMPSTSSGSTSCPSEQYWDSASNTCMTSTYANGSGTTCSSGQYWNGTVCVSSTDSTSYTSSCSSALQTLLGTGCHWMYTETDGRGIYCNNEMNKSAHEGDTTTTGTCTYPSESSYTYSSGSTSTYSSSASCPSGQWWNGTSCMSSTSGTTTTTSSVILSWTAPSGATRYQIYRKLEGGSWNTLASNVTTVTYTDTLPVGTHEYYVQACSDTSGCSKDAALRVTVGTVAVSSVAFDPYSDYSSQSTYSYNTAHTSYAGDANSCPGFSYSRLDKNGKRYCQLNSERKCDYTYPSYLTNGTNYKAESCPVDDALYASTYVPPSSSCPSNVTSVLGTGCHQTYTDSDPSTCQLAGGGATYDATINGTVKKTDGKPMAYAWVSISAYSADTEAVVDYFYKKPLSTFSEGAQTDKDGAFSVTVPPGTYYARVYTPPQSGIINPKEEKITIASGETKTVTLEFRKANIAVSGTTVVGDTAHEAFVFGWSEKGGYIETRSGSDGSYTLKVGPNETWRVAAKANYQNNYYKSYEVTLKTGESGDIKQDIVLTAEKTLPQPVTKAMDADKPNVVTTSGGAKVNVPANSVASAGQATITMNATVELPEQSTAKVVGTGYDINAYDSAGKEVNKLNTELTVTIPYDPEELKNLGIEPKDLKVAYYDETAATWKELTASAVNETEKTVTAVASHLTRFALVAAADTIPPSAPAAILANALGNGSIKITWNNPEKDFKYTNVYRSEKENELGALRSAEIKGKEFTDDEGLKDGVTYYYTVRAVDSAGNESQNTAQTKIKASGTSVKTAATFKTRKTMTPAAKPAAAAVGKLDKNFSAGAKGDEVKTLQNILVQEGLLSADSATGYFGKLTKEAVIKFQEKYADEILKPAGLTKGNGFIGAGTRAKLNQLIK